MNKPFLSVISPCGGDNSMLSYFLQSLQYQTLDQSQFEVLLAGEDGEQWVEIASLYDTRYVLNLVKQALPPDFKGHSAGILRNTAARLAQGQWLVFIDSDIILDPKALQVYAENLAGAEHSNLAYYGNVSELPAYNWNLIGAPSFYISQGSLFQAALPDHRESPDNDHPLLLPAEVPWRYWYTSNATVSKAAFDAVGGFDESAFRCHDMDLAFRLYKTLGCSFQRLSDAKGLHIEHIRSYSTIIDQTKGFLNLVKKYPELTFYVNDQVILNNRHLKYVLECSEKAFLDIIKGQDGRRIGPHTWMFPKGTALDTVLSLLKYVPYTLSQQPESLRINLRLHRTCWDYHFIIPIIPEAPAPAISILIPAFNAAGTLERCLNSVYANTMQNFEILCVDDASTDNTIRVAQPYTFDGRLRIISLPTNKGQSYALNKALELAEADIVTQLDVDDYLDPDALNTILAYFSLNPNTGAIYTDPFIHDEHFTVVKCPVGRPVSEGPHGFFEYAVPQVGRSYRRRFLLDIGGWQLADAYGGRIYEDRLTLSRMAMHYPVDYLPARFYHVTTEPGSLSRIAPLETASAKLAILHERLQRLNLKGEFLYEDKFLSVSNIRPFARPKVAEINISVIIPFAGFAPLLEFTILSWLQSDLSPRSEIIVVDDASGENLDTIVALDQRIRLECLVEKHGPAYARNRGAALARYDLLFFNDSDHVVPPQVVNTHSEFHAKQGDSFGAVVGCVFGRRTYTWVSPDIPKNRKGKLLETCLEHPQFEEIARKVCCSTAFNLLQGAEKSVWEACQDFTFTDSWLSAWGEAIIRYGTNLQDYPYKWARLSSGSFSIRADIFKKLGGFDEQLQSMEDWDFGMRLQNAGGQIVCAPEAEPRHQVHPTDTHRDKHNRASFQVIIRKNDYFEKLLEENGNHTLPPAHGLIRHLKNTPDGPTPIQSKPRPTEMPATIVLTFDDGPHPYGTAVIADMLQKFAAPATFFVLGTEAEQHPEWLLHLCEQGHSIGVHAWTHSDFSQKTTVEALDELSKAVTCIESIINQPVKYARPPYGRLSPGYLTACETLGLQLVGWDVSVGDWQFVSAREMIARLAVQSLQNKVFLFHDAVGNPFNTAKCLAWLLEYCQCNDITVCDLPAFQSNLPKFHLHYANYPF